MVHQSEVLQEARVSEAAAIVMLVYSSTVPFHQKIVNTINITTVTITTFTILLSLLLPALLLSLLLPSLLLLSLFFFDDKKSQNCLAVGQTP